MTTCKARVLLGLSVFLAAGSLLLSQEPQQKPEATVEDAGWPRTYQGDGASLVLYQPQIETGPTINSSRAEPRSN